MADQPGFVPCPHCPAIGLGANAIEKHITLRHSGEPRRHVVFVPGEPRGRVEWTS